MSDKEAQVDWDDDGHDRLIEMMPEQLRDELARAHSMRACIYDLILTQARLNKARQYSEGLEHRIEILNQLLNGSAVELAQARDELAAERRFRVTEHYHELTQVRAELKDLQGANREYGRQLASMRDNREFWYKEAQVLETDLKLNAKMLADQCDQAREAEEEHGQLVDRVEDAMGQIEKYDEHLAGNLIQYAVEDVLERLVEAERELKQRQRQLDLMHAAEAALIDCGISGIYAGFDGLADAIKQMVKRLVQLEGGQALQNERQLRQEAERRAKALAQLVTEETVRLLERLASHTRADADKSTPSTLVNLERNDIWAAHRLAAQIREALDDSQA